MSTESPDTASRTSSAETGGFKLSYEDLRHERERLRDARASVTSQLGPLPISAGIAFGIVSGFSPDVQQRGWLFVAICSFAAMVIVGSLYSGLQPYRQLRAKHEKLWRKSLDERFQSEAADAQARGLQTQDLLSESDWYAAMIRLERDVYGGHRTDNKLGLPLRSKVANLQDAFDRERTGLNIVRFLFVVVIICLVFSRI